MHQICVVTGARSEYGLLRGLMQDIHRSPELELNLVVTGMHLSPEFGLTYREIEQDGFQIDRKIEMLMSSDTPVGVSKSMGLAMVGFADAFAELKPDIVVLLGDRYEIFCAASACMIAGIPIAHLHGGESTEGSIDNSIRHAITQMSTLHFVAAEQYRKRVIQMVDRPEHVFLVGGFGVDALRKQAILNRDEFEKSIEFKLGERNLLVTFHPATREKSELNELLKAFDEFQDIHLIITMPNADPGARELIQQLAEFVKKRPNSCLRASLGYQRYMSAVNWMDGVVGNSSSGLLEVPSFQKGTINIGDRQKGRLKASSVIDCLADRTSIIQAIHKLYSADFQASLKDVRNPYGEGGSAEKTLQILSRWITGNRHSC